MSLNLDRNKTMNLLHLRLDCRSAFIRLQIHSKIPAKKCSESAPRSHVQIQPEVN